MAIAKKPGSKQTTGAPPSDEQAEKFISGASKSAPAEEDAKKAPVMIRFDPELLKRVDTAAKHRGVSRSAWVQFTLSRALDQGEG
jgi:predicted HicB family RNase H-like nuclease